jgi:CheY-like chemotaxis protein
LARKILLADDSVTAQNMGRKILSDAGYEVIAVNNGSAALKKIAEHKPDLVILDVYMPGYSGLEVCQRLKEAQETARIPVLLTVGKLEPFKPEEAQRVRAEGYIVKPFEATELLSSLSKLEDKVVPRPEASKPGRFARAIASVEAASRNHGNEAAPERRAESRIGFPKPKSASEEAAADESSFYNPMNRDLRTVVETAAEKAAGRQTEERTSPAFDTSETSVDLAALAPAGLPHSVTPEEVFAIAAAAAQIQMAEGAFTEQNQVSEGQGEFQVSPAEIPANAAEVPPATQAEAPVDSSALQTESIENQVAENSISQTAVAETSNPETKTSAASAERVAVAMETAQAESMAHDGPVTMAATAESVLSGDSSSPRWRAVSLALEGDEAAVSLEHEMQKAYAASASEASVLGSVAARENPVAAVEETPAIGEILNPVPEPVVEPVVSAQSGESIAAPSTEPEPVSETTVVVAPETNLAKTNIEEMPAAESAAINPAAAQPANDSPQAAVAEASESVISQEETTEASSPHGFAESDQSQSHVGELASPENFASPENNVAAVAVAEQQEAASSGVENTLESPIPPEAPTVATTEATESNTFATTAQVEVAELQANEESDTVKTAAAAWANWRQFRDATQSSEPQAQSKNGPHIWSHAEVEEVQNADLSAPAEIQQGSQPDNIQQGGIQASESQTSELQQVEVQAADLQPTEAQTAAVQAIESQSSETQPGNTQFREFKAPTLATSSAWAVAAGAEQFPREMSGPPEGNLEEVASIVDSVLADLRPKLMAEISRKMAEKK